MSIEGQGHFFTIYFPGFVCFVLYLAKISGERLQDHWSSGFSDFLCFDMSLLLLTFTLRGGLFFSFELDFLRNYCANKKQTLYESFQVQGNENLMT